MKLDTMLFSKKYTFGSVKEVLAKANEKKSGDTLAGIGAADAKERTAAKCVLSDLTVEEITNSPAVDYESDSVTRIILDDLDQEQYNKIKRLTIGELRERILDNKLPGSEILALARGMSSEVIAALAKLMGNLDLMYVSRKLHITASCNTTIGEPGTFAARLQPNHPTDDVKGVTASLLEGLSYGAGDAVIGLNPAIDTVKSTTDILNLFNDVKTRLNIPTQIYCGDGLSAPSVGANVPDILPMLTLALEDDSVTVGKPFFVRYCRVNTAREIGPLLGAKVICVLIGERPGLLTDESMSAYIAYKPHPDMSESDYTVVSNISRFGMPPVEAGAYIAGIIKKMLIQKASGLSLKL